MGSGEMAASMVEVHKYAMSLVEGPVRAAFVDTPAGFQLNADLIAEKAVRYSRQSLNTELAVASFKSAQQAALEETQAAVSTLLEASYIFAGPGSPTYAINNWRYTPVLDAMFETLAHGGCLAFASAAALALGRLTIPVYEIYKVGESPHWVEGLNILAHNGLDVAVVPHWNNTSGGDHDTRFCFMGEERWQILESMLPPATTVLGIDEHTACLLRMGEDICEVRGVGRVTVRREGVDHTLSDGDRFSLDLLRAPAAVPGQPSVTSWLESQAITWEAIRTRHEALLAADGPPLEDVTAYIYDLLAFMSVVREDRQTAQQAEEALREALVCITARLDGGPGNVDELIAPYVDLLVEIRADLRAAGQWEQADHIRDRLLEQGITIQDGADGTTWQRVG